MGQEPSPHAHAQTGQQQWLPPVITNTVHCHSPSTSLTTNMRCFSYADLSENGSHPSQYYYKYSVIEKPSEIYCTLLSRQRKITELTVLWGRWLASGHDGFWIFSSLCLPPFLPVGMLVSTFHWLEQQLFPSCAVSTSNLQGTRKIRMEMFRALYNKCKELGVSTWVPEYLSKWHDLSFPFRVLKVLSVVVILFTVVGFG